MQQLSYVLRRGYGPAVRDGHDVGSEHRRGADVGSGLGRATTIGLGRAADLVTKSNDSLGTPSARSLLVAILNLHVIGAGGSAWTATLLAALEAVGVQEKAARRMLQRLSTEGWLTAERHGRQVRWVLTEHARVQMAREQHIARFEAGKSPQDWLVLVVSLGRDQHDNRRRLRRSLVSFGWGNVSPGVWLNSGSTPRDAVLEILRRQGLEKDATIFGAEFLGPSPESELISRTWDLVGLRARYREFLDRFATIEPTSDDEVFVARTLMTDAWMRVFRADPFLPEAHLPADWPGRPARQFIDDRMKRWAPAADRWWHAAEVATQRRD